MGNEHKYPWFSMGGGPPPPPGGGGDFACTSKCMKSAMLGVNNDQDIVCTKRVTEGSQLHFNIFFLYYFRWFLNRFPYK